jgi:putative glycerol-1-phosphate prenyltransferase
MPERILKIIHHAHTLNQKSLAVLVDPDVYNREGKIKRLLEQMEACHIDYFFIGGSLLNNPDISELVKYLKLNSKIPLILFPGNGLYLNHDVDAILFLSLISGRNPEFLIGQHVPIAAALKESKVEVIPTGYILIDGGRTTSVSYLSFTNPIPNDKPEIVSSTAMAGELLGMKLIYLEAGSGASSPVPENVIQHVCHSIDVPLIVGGGINTTERAINALHAGADIIVIGNKLEQNPEFIKDVSYILKKYNESLNVHK